MVESEGEVPGGRPHAGLHDGPAETLRHHIPAAVRVYGELLDEADRDSTRLEAANAVLDRVYGKPTVRSEHRSQATISVIFVDEPDARPPRVIDVHGSILSNEGMEP
jgi:hypothetical protein